MYIILALSILVLAVAILAFLGRAAWLIPGYGAMSDIEKTQIDTKGFGRVMGGYLLLVALGIFALLYSGFIPWVIWVFPVIVILATAGLLYWISKKIKK